MADSTTTMTIKLFDTMGWKLANVEQYNSFSKKKTDLFGFADLVGIHSDFAPTAIQLTSGRSNAAARKRKIEANPNARLWAIRADVFVVWWEKDRRFIDVYKKGKLYSLERIILMPNVEKFYPDGKWFQFTSFQAKYISNMNKMAFHREKWRLERKGLAAPKVPVYSPASEGED